MDNNRLKNKICVIVVEDHPTMRKGIITTLGEDKDGSFEVVGEAETGYQALLLCQEKQPDAMILDLHLTGDMSGLEVISEVRRQKFPLRILVFTGTRYASEAARREMGADRYLLKDASDDEIIATIKEMVAEILPANHTYGTGANQPTLELISPREIEILSLAAKGLNHQQISEKLNVTRETIGVQCTRIFTKLRVNNMTHAVGMAVHNKIIKLDNSE